MKKSFAGFLIVGSILLFASDGFSAVFYMKATGVKTRSSGPSLLGNWNDTNCYGNLYTALHSMSGGDTLIINDGIYSGGGNAINQFTYPPSGTLDNLTVIKARNIPGQNGIPISQPLKVIFDTTASFSASNFPSNDATKYVQYVKFEGIRWNGGISGYMNFNRLYFKQCAVEGTIDGNASAISMSGQNNLFEDVVAFGKGRYKFLFYDPSREAQTRGDGNNVCRRCIARLDWANKNNIAQNPIAGFASYFNRGTALLNSMVIDSDQPLYWMENPGELSGAFYQPNDSGPHKLTIKGSIVMNVAMSALYTRQGSSGHVLEDVLAINTAGGFGLWGATTANRLSLLKGGVGNFPFRSTTQSNNVLAPNVGLYTGNTGGSSVINSVLYRITGYGVQGTGLATDYLNIYSASAGNFSGSPVSPHLITSNPVYNALSNPTGSLKFPVRTEHGSLLSTSGSSGGRIGAHIMYKLGKDGTFKGDPDWDTEQGSLWPWPLEEWVQAEMRSMDRQIWSDGIGQIAPYNTPHWDTMPDPNRGFCAPGQTLTKYIWEALGNPLPSGIYQTGPMPPTGLRGGRPTL